MKTRACAIKSDTIAIGANLLYTFDYLQKGELKDGNAK
jgi:hypothetical protein